MPKYLRGNKYSNTSSQHTQTKQHILGDSSTPSSSGALIEPHQCEATNIHANEMRIKQLLLKQKDKRHERTEIQRKSEQGKEPVGGYFFRHRATQTNELLEQPCRHSLENIYHSIQSKPLCIHSKHKSRLLLQCENRDPLPRIFRFITQNPEATHMDLHVMLRL